MQRLPGIASIFNQDRPEADEAYEAAIPGPSQYSPEPFNANGMYWQAPPIQALPFPQWQAQVVLASEHGNMDIDEHVHMVCCTPGRSEKRMKGEAEMKWNA